MRLLNGFLIVLLAILMPANLAQAAFHLMQIEQVIGGVNGDTTAQAIQLRMRSVGQNVVSLSKVVVVDAAGANPILLENLTTNVANSQAGRRVLLATSSFGTYTDAGTEFEPDFFMDAIPASYLAEGQLRFMDDGSTIYWSLSWGGAGYTGSTAGDFTNDSNGNFGPPFGSALPSTSLQALQFTGISSAASTSNSLQYAVTAGAATFVNNAGTSFTLVTPSMGLDGDYNENDEIDAADYTVWRDALTAGATVLANDPTPGVVDESDFIYWRDHFGDTLGSGAGSGAAAVPEPTIACLAGILAVAALFSGIFRGIRLQSSSS
jgi:hypothetical protein